MFLFSLDVTESIILMCIDFTYQHDIKDKPALQLKAVM